MLLVYQQRRNEMATEYQRQTGIINIEKFRDNKITIVGCGANGSFIGLALAKMGLTKFKLYDFDTVEVHNLPNQFFSYKDIGKKKVKVTARYMKHFNRLVKVEEFDRFKRSDNLDTQIVISCVDKMKVRKEIFNSCKKNKEVQLFIDTRMAGLQGQVYTVDMGDKEEIENYDKTLFGDDEAVKQRCTERSILFTVLGISSIVCNQVVKALKEEELRNYIVLDYIVPQLI